MHVIAAKAVAFREALSPEFAKYQQKVIDNARAMAAIFLARDFDIVSGGTDNHLLLIDLSRRGVTGKAADAALGAANITVNKNTVPNDPQSPFVTSGVRIGTPAITSRGMGTAEAEALAGWMCDLLEKLGDPQALEAEQARVRAKVAELCAAFPVYAGA